MNKDSAIEFSDEVQAIINEIVPASDEIDLPDFQLINYINQMFKTEQSLANIETTIDSMQTQVDLVQDNIRTLLKDQVLTSNEGDEALSESMRIIRQLFGEVTGIKTRAENTEEIVKEITRDIKQLDCAKTNLTTSITILNHLRMLVDGVETLQKLTELRIYNEIMNPLEAVIEVNSHFQSYHDIPQIKVQSNALEKIKTDLAEQILEDFKASFSGKKEKSITFTQLKDACCIASVLDPKVKQNLLSWFLDLQMAEYSQLFHENQDIAWLSKIDKRYSWLKKHLLEFEEKLGNDLENLMRKRRPEIDVNLLLFAINKTKHFESLLGKRFSGITLTKKVAEKVVESDEPVNPFENLICECFQGHLDIYLQSVDKNMKELIEKFAQDEESSSKKQESSNIFPSAADLFVFYKKCLIQCQQFTNTKSLIDLTLLFKKYLREYAKFVESNIPKAFNQGQVRLTFINCFHLIKNLNS
uniref:Vps53 N-terminal domain-containing protein n=1 Tax=Megaselia scalaris TaxID=36166 RepID=T1H317_MEGSC